MSSLLWAVWTLENKSSRSDKEIRRARWVVQQCGQLKMFDIATKRIGDPVCINTLTDCQDCKSE